MKDRKRRNIIIGSLCALLVFMGIGYAIISQMLTIRGVSTVQGDWNIYIDSITPNAVGTGVSVSESVGLDKVSASFEANLYAPGDKVEYKVVVKNDGNIDAKLGAVSQKVSSDTDNIVKYSNTLENGYILRHGESYVFYVTTELPEELEELPENTVRAVLDLKLNFTQYTGGGSGEEEEVKTELLTGTYQSIESTFDWTLYTNGDIDIHGDGVLSDTVEGMSIIQKVALTLAMNTLSDEDLMLVGSLNDPYKDYLVPFFTDYYSDSSVDELSEPTTTRSEFFEYYEEICNDESSSLCSTQVYNTLATLYQHLDTYDNIPKFKNINVTGNVTEIIGDVLRHGAYNTKVTLPTTLTKLATYTTSSNFDLTNLVNLELLNAIVYNSRMYLPRTTGAFTYVFEASRDSKIFIPSTINYEINDATFGSTSGMELYFEAKYDNLPSNLRSYAINKNVTVYYGCSDIDASTCDGIFE